MDFVKAMRLLLEISDETLGIGKREQLDTKYRVRKSARAVLVNEKGEVAIQHLAIPNYYKLPGGGVEQGESLEEALKREIKEEVGCDCEIEKEVGVIIEYRNEMNLLHISYCYTARVVGVLGEAEYEQGELDEGQRNIWVAPEEARALFKGSVTNIYKSKFIVLRDGTFFAEALKSGLS